MSVIWENVETADRKKDWSIYFKMIRVKIDPATKHQLNLPSDYEYRSVVVPRRYADWSERLIHFNVRKDDIWIGGSMKTGTTLMHNIVWQLANGMDFNAAAKKSSDEHFEGPVLFDELCTSEKLIQFENEIIEKFNQFDRMPSPRIFKTHLPAFLLPKDTWTAKSKIIYIARNPKDVIVSFYYMVRNNAFQYKGTLEQLAQYYRKNEGFGAPFFDHIFSFWQLRKLDHILFLTYEDFLADPFGGVKKISEFLECSYDDNQLKQLTEFVSFDNLRKHRLENRPADITDGKMMDPNYR